MSTRQAYVPEHVTLAAKHGASWLDENYPRWVDAINLDRLNMEQGNTCILGQIWEAEHPESAHGFSKFMEQVSRTGTDPEEWAAEHGFDVQDADYLPDDYPYLDRAWTQIVKDRREG